MNAHEKIKALLSATPPYDHAKLMSMGRWKCGAIDTLRILKFLWVYGDFKWASMFPPEVAGENSIFHAFPDGCPEKVVKAKMRKLIRKGWVEGCACGCRGDFYLTKKGRILIAEKLCSICN